jgi:hypothetical protein
MTPDELWFSDTAEGPWEWKGPVIALGTVAYGKFFRGKAGFVSLECLPDLINWRRRPDAPALSTFELEALAAIEQRESLLISELRKMLGWTSPPKPRRTPLEKHFEGKARLKPPSASEEEFDAASLGNADALYLSSKADTLSTNAFSGKTEVLSGKADALSTDALSGKSDILLGKADALSGKADAPTKPSSKSAVDAIISRLQMATRLVIADFEYNYTKQGERFGWGKGRYTTPELMYGDELATATCSPEESLHRIISRLARELPQAKQAQIAKLII